MVRTLKNIIYIVPKNNPKCKNSLNKLDKKKPRLLNFVTVNMFA